MLPVRYALPLQSWSQGASEVRCDRHRRQLGMGELGGAAPKLLEMAGATGLEGLPKALGRT
eukprot:787226-Pyramimonas_sp.AAC.1